MLIIFGYITANCPVIVFRASVVGLRDGTPEEVLRGRKASSRSSGLWPLEGDGDKPLSHSSHLDSRSFSNSGRLPEDPRKLPKLKSEFRGVLVWQSAAPAHRRESAGWRLLLRSERTSELLAEVPSLRRERCPARARRGNAEGGLRKKADRTRRSHVCGGHRPGLSELLHRGGAEGRHRDHRQ